MIEAFSAYIKTIAAFTLFAAFAGMIMPDNNFKKYISLIMGVLLLSAILKPIFTIFNIDDWSLYNIADGKTEIFSTQNLQEDEEYYVKLEKAQIIKLYEENLDKEIQSDINERFGNEYVSKTSVTQDDLSIELWVNENEKEAISEYIKNKYFVRDENLIIHIE